MVQRRPHGPRANQTGYSLRRHGAPGESRKGCHRTRASKAGQRSPKHPSRWNAAADGSCRVRRPGRHSPGWMLLNNSGRSHDSRCPDPGAGSRLFRVKPGLLADARPPKRWRATRAVSPWALRADSARPNSRSWSEWQCLCLPSRSRGFDSRTPLQLRSCGKPHRAWGSGC